ALPGHPGGPHPHLTSARRTGRALSTLLYVNRRRGSRTGFGGTPLARSGRDTEECAMIEPARAPDRASRCGQRPLPPAGAIGRSEMRAAPVPGRQRLLRIPTTSVAPVPKALACVMGDLDLVRPLGLAGIACAAVTRPGNPSIYSRF